MRYRQDIIDAKIGDPIDVCPGIYGGHNWQATAYNPDSSSLIIPLHQLCVEMVGQEVQMVEGYGGYGGASRVYPMPGINGMLGRLTSWDLNRYERVVEPRTACHVPDRGSDHGRRPGFHR